MLRLRTEDSIFQTFYCNINSKAGKEEYLLFDVRHLEMSLEYGYQEGYLHSFYSIIFR